MLRIAILGAGHFAEAHLKALERLSGRGRVVCIARRRLDAPLAEGVPVVAPEAAIESPEVDAVAVCLPNNLHRRYAEMALKAGKHVFCEKPLALNAADADVVIAAAERAGRILTVGHLTRYVPAYQAAADVLTSGRLGAIRAAYASRLQVGKAQSWRMDPDVGGGVVFDLLIHDLDLLNWYLGPPESVYAQGRRHTQGAFEHMGAVFTYAGGAVAMAEGSFMLPQGASLTAQLRILCENGVIEIVPGDAAAPVRVREAGQPEEHLAVKTEDLLIEGLVGEYEEFLDVIEGATSRRRLHLADARSAVEAAALTNQAAAKGQVISFGPGKHADTSRDAERRER